MRKSFTCGGYRYICDETDWENYAFLVYTGKGKVLPYSLPSVWPGTDPGVQAISPQVTF